MEKGLYFSSDCILIQIDSEIQRKIILYFQVDCSEYKRLERGRPIYCERLYQPFCGSDGKTYNNKCSFCKAVLRSRGALHMKQAGAC
uniref:Ovomucoid n=1 Tax=Strix occidentalis caurina TaxID=311401 RepID=A0A8D0EQC2_STROC